MLMRHYGVIVAATVPAIVLSGCGAKSKPDTQYRGSYRAAYTIPAVNEAGTFTFTVEQKGGMTGSFIDNNSGKIYAFNGEVATSGYFSGTLKNGPDSFRIEGTLNISGPTTGGGDFKQTRSNQEYRGSFSLTDTVITPTPGSSYRGPYSGSYNIPGLGETGTLSFSVNSRGDINGSWTRENETALFTGTVQESGAFAGTIAFATENLAISGTLNRTTNATTSGNFQLVQGGKSFPGTFGSTDTAPAGDSPFQGAYRGTYSVPESQENGNLSFTVDPRGKLTGFFSQSSNKPVGTFTGAFNNDGTFVGNVTYDPSTNLAARPITGKLQTSELNGLKAGDFVWTIDGKNYPGNFEVGIGASEPDSIYRGAYGGPNISNGISFSSTSGATGTRLDNPELAGDADSLVLDANNNARVTGTVTTLTFTIDKQGRLVGTLGGYPLDVRVTNDGRVFGTYDGFPVRGNISRQLIRVLLSFDIDTEKRKITYSYGDKDGIAGDLIVTINGREFPASIAGVGGNPEGASPR
ncbi:MAG: hypothetical protein SFU56_11885 [Capsulimonadales bacterium]|nr:hypothetical protein [Capsulimonadales bacterium]